MPRRRLPLSLVLCIVVLLFSALRAHALSTPAEAAAMGAAAADHTAYTLPPEKLVKAVALDHFHMAMWVAGTVWGVLSVYLLLQLGIIARLRDLAVRRSGNRWAQGLVFWLGFLLLMTLLDLPLGMYRHVISLQYGLSVQGWGSWFGDQGKSLGLAAVFGFLGVMLLFRVIRKTPRYWWLRFSIVAMVFSVIGVFLTPYVIDPLFNRFEPLSQSNPGLVAQLEKVVARGHGIDIPPERMFLMKASDKVTTLNAYVTGFGASKRVVVWDTSIQKGTPDEILFIFGHEMGHYVLGHIVSGLLFSFLLTVVSFFVGFQMIQWLLRRFGARWRIPSQEDWGALAVLVLVLSVVSFFLEPVANGFSRAHEHEADVYGQEVVHGIIANPQVSAQAAFQLLGENSFDYPEPSPLYEFWTGSHPSIPLRAAFAKYYNPWAPGAEPKYFKR